MTAFDYKLLTSKSPNSCVKVSATCEAQHLLPALQVSRYRKPNLASRLVEPVLATVAGNLER